MKKMTKMLSLILSLSMLASMAACDFGKTDETDTQTPESTTQEQETVLSDPYSDIERKNYDTYLNMYAYYGEAGFLYSATHEGSLLSKELYIRQRELKDRLGITLLVSDTKDPWNGYDDYKNAVKNKDGSIDIYYIPAYRGVTELISGGYLRDFKKIDGLKLDAEHWDKERMESLSLYDRYYLGYGDLCVPDAYAIVFSKKTMSEHAEAFGESIYDCVKDYRWTLDKMISLSNLVYCVKDDSEDYRERIFYGLAGIPDSCLTAFLQASDIQGMVKDGNGGYEIAVWGDKYKEKTADLIDTLGEWASTSAHFTRDEDAYYYTFHEEFSLMYFARIRKGIPTGAEDFEIGVLPYPMYDEAQKDVGYRHMNFNGHLTVPSYSRNLTMVADALEIMNRASGDIPDAVFERFLGKPTSEAPEDAEMFSLIWDTLCTDPGYAYAVGDMISLMSSVQYSLGYRAYYPPDPKEIESYMKSTDRALDKFLRMVEKMEE